MEMAEAIFRVAGKVLTEMETVMGEDMVTRINIILVAVGEMEMKENADCYLAGTAINV